MFCLNSTDMVVYINTLPLQSNPLGYKNLHNLLFPKFIISGFSNNGVLYNVKQNSNTMFIKIYSFLLAN